MKKSIEQQQKTLKIELKKLEKKSTLFRLGQVLNIKLETPNPFSVHYRTLIVMKANTHLAAKFNIRFKRLSL